MTLESIPLKLSEEKLYTCTISFWTLKTSSFYHKCIFYNNQCSNVVLYYQDVSHFSERSVTLWNQPWYRTTGNSLWDSHGHAVPAHVWHALSEWHDVFWLQLWTIIWDVQTAVSCVSTNSQDRMDCWMVTLKRTYLKSNM